MGKERAYSVKPSITSGDQCRASLPGLALLLSMGAGGGPWGPQATGLMPAALGQTPQKPPGQIPCQHKVSLSKSYSVDQESAHPDHLKLAKSQPILTMSSKQRASPSKSYPASRKSAQLIVSGLQIASLSRARPPVTIVSRNSRASPSRSRPASRTRPHCIQLVESKPVSIGSRHSRASLSRSRPTPRELARPDHIQLAGSQPVQIASSQRV